MARTYKRDSRGRFAGGGGGSGGGGKKATSKPAGSGDGRRGPRGGKVGTKAEQARAKKAQAARSAEFRGKSTAGRGAKAAYKAAQGAARKAGKVVVKAQSQKPARQSAALARGERILSRFQSIGQGRTGRKLRQSQIVKQRAANFLRDVAPYSLYGRGSRKGQARHRGEILTGLAKNLQSKDKVKKAARTTLGPASGIRQRLAAQAARGGIRGESRLQTRASRSGLGPQTDAEYRQSLSYYGKRSPNKIDTSVAVRKRAMSFLANPRSGVKLPALSKPRPQQPGAAQKPKPAPTAKPKPLAPSGVRLSDMQRSEAKYAKRKYGVHSTVSNPGRRSRRGKMTTTSSGARVMSTGRTRSQAGAAQSRKIKRLLTENNPSGSRLRRVKKLPQMNIFGGADVGTYLKPAAKGPRRRYRTRGSSRSNSAPRGRYS